MSRTSAYNIQPRLRLKFSVSLIQALAAWSILALSQPCNGQTIVPYTQDPAGYAIGFARGHWANSVSKMVVFFGSTRPASDDNSIRAFNPVTNSWEYLWSNGPFNGGLQTRDNYASLYVPRLDELWVWGGSHLETLPGALRSGRFSIAQKKWIATSTTDNGAFSDVVQNFGGFLSDPAMAWSEQADMGLMFGGSGEGNASNRYWIIEPNSDGPQPYKMSEIIGGVRPPPRAEAMNLMVAVGPDFYMLGGYAGSIDGQWTFVTDLWKFSGNTRAWTQLPAPPKVGFTPTLTYDSDRNVLLAWVDNKIYIFDLITQQWSDQTPAGLSCIFNQVGVYAPTAKLHLFEGGNKCPDGDSVGPTVYAVSLNAQIALQGAPQQLSSTSISPQPPISGPAGYTLCANENQTCSFSGQKSVAYGANNNFAFLNLTGGTACTNTVFGDPIFGTVKACYTSDIPQTLSPTSTSGSAPPPTIAPTVAPTAPLVSTSSSPATDSIDIPLRTWVSRPLPLRALDAQSEVIGARGFGPTPFGTGAKHQRLVYNPDNQRVYFYSGDFNGPVGQSSFRTDMFSYDITRSVSSDTSDLQNWILEWPYCGLPGQVSPAHTDEAPFTWDSKRHVFWITGGYETSTEDVVSMCANGAITYGNSASTSNNPVGNASHGPDILQFDPAQNKYIRPDAKYTLPGSALAQDGTPLLGGAQTPRHSVYNPVTDEIIMMGQHGAWGNYVIRMNAETGVWTRDGGGIGGTVASDAIDGTYINDTIATHEQLALDIEHQWIYWIDTYHKQDPDPNHRFRLMRYDITLHNMVNLGWITLPSSGSPSFCNLNNGPDSGCPTFPYYQSPNDSTMLVYDPINKVVLWPASSNEGRPILIIYHPDPGGGKNGTWEIDPMNRDKPNEVIFGSNGTFIPELNAMVMYGGFANGSGNPDLPVSMNYFWLYRYGNGNGQPYVPPTPVVTPPATPTPVTSPPTQTPPVGPAGYIFCATENQTCSFTGQKSLAYGANNNFSFLNLSGGTECTNLVFGDPVIGTVKACYIKDIPAQVPAPPVATDTTPPSVLILSPLAGASASKIITVKITATDNVGIVKVELYKDGVLVGTTTTSPYNFDWDTTKDSNGAHTLIAMAYDTSANRASAVISVNVNNTRTSSPNEVSVVLQDGLNGYSGTQDTSLYYYYPSFNFGSADELVSGEGEGSYNMLVRYVIFQSEGGAIPNGATVKSATLSLYKYSPYDETFQAYRVLKDWREMDASWNNANATARWAVDGAFGSNTDNVATPDGQAVVGWDPSWLEIDVTSGLQAMSNGAGNYGWHIVGLGTNTNALRFHSREYQTDPTLRPKLTIVYTEAAR